MTENGSSKSESHTRQQILEAALEAFATRGYHDTKVSDIVEGSRTSKGAVYFHFPSKEKIFLGLVDEFAALLEDSLQTVLAEDDSGIQRVNSALDMVIETFTRYRRLTKVFLVQAAGLGQNFEVKRLEIHRRFIAIIREQLEEACREGSIQDVDPEIMAYVWMGAINEVIISWIHDGHPEPEDTLPVLRKILLRSLGINEE